MNCKCLTACYLALLVRTFPLDTGREAVLTLLCCEQRNPRFHCFVRLNRANGLASPLTTLLRRFSHALVLAS